MAIRYVGIDLHKRLIVAHVLDAAGNDESRHLPPGERPRPGPWVAGSKATSPPRTRSCCAFTTNCWAVVRATGAVRRRQKLTVLNCRNTKANAKAKVKPRQGGRQGKSWRSCLLLGYPLPKSGSPDHATRDLRE